MAPPIGVVLKFWVYSEGASQPTEQLPRINLRPTMHGGLSINFPVLETLCIVTTDHAVGGHAIERHALEKQLSKNILNCRINGHF